MGFSNAADRFHLAVPVPWSGIDVTSPNADQQFQAAALVDPHLKTIYPNGVASLEASRTKFLAIGPISTATGYRAEVVVSVDETANATPADLDAFAAQAGQNFAKAGATVLSNIPITVAGQKAIQILLNLKVTTTGGRSVEVPEMLDVMVQSGKVYTLLFAGDNGMFTAIQETFGFDS